MEDWTLALYSKKHGGWIHDETRITDITFKGPKSLELRTKTPSYFETRPSAHLEPSKSALRDSARLRATSSPIDHYRLFNFFRPTDDQFVSKFQNGCIYLSIIILNSDNKILLSPIGLPPTVLVSTVGGLANYYNFDSDSSDFAWMFKTTLDWASDPPLNRFRDPRSGAASPELRAGYAGSTTTPTFSPPNSRGSFSRSKRGSVSSVTGPSIIGSSGNSTGLKGAASSISADRASITSDSTRYQSIYEYVQRRQDYRGENSLRQEYVAAVEEVQQKLGNPPIDLMYDRVVDLPLVGAKTIMAIQHARDNTKDHIAPELMQMGSFRWRHIDSVSNSVYTRKEEVWSHLSNYYDNVRVSRPSPGLYVGLYYTESTMSGLQILVPRQRRTFVPIVKLRDKADLSPEEWEWMKSTSSMDVNQFAKNCAVSKDDPMHHLKVEFAHSTAKLSKITQIKWNPSDMYTLDTLQVVMQSMSPASSRVSQEFSTSSPGRSKQGVTTLPQSMAAMDQDLTWKDHTEIDTSKTFRVILFIKPTRHATQSPEHYNKQLFELSPFPIFDALHHSVFNNVTYHQLRKTMLHLTNEIVDLEIVMEQEVEDELAQQKENDLEGENQMPEENEDDMTGSLIIDELGIKGDSHPHAQCHHPRLRSSFIGDETIHGAHISKRVSANSLLEALERAVPSVTSVLSLASSLSSLGNEPTTATIEPQELPAEFSERVRSRMSAIEFEIDRTAYGIGRRRGSRASQDFSHIEDKNDTTPLSFMDMIQDLDPVAGDGSVISASLNNISTLSLQSTDSSCSASSVDSYSNRHNFLREKERRLSLGHAQNKNGPLPPLPPFPRHRRSQSLVQTGDLRMSPAPVPGINTSRSRTNSHSSYIHPYQTLYYHHYQHQQPVYKNRYLTSKNYPHYLSHVQQHQHFQQHNNSNDNNNDSNNGSSDDLDSTNSQYPTELRRLEREQQGLQERWRMVSWTRQLNEWDHARTLKSQGELLGIGMGMGMSMGLGINLNMNVDMSGMSGDSDPEPTQSEIP
ncbi:hypothetical protein BGZ58_004720 [Dissophora ornata]|nr:hypothetical protein BGZ58_004720 [Dissophora ornata]